MAVWAPVLGRPFEGFFGEDDDGPIKPPLIAASTVVHAPTIDQGVWGTATFVWDVGDAVTASSNLITATDADVALTEGTYVSSPRDGRTYTGATGSRFTFSPSPDTDGFTTMMSVSADAAENVYLWIGDKDSSNNYINGEWNGDTANNQFSFRDGGGTLGSDSWPGDVWENSRLADNGTHIVMMRGEKLNSPATNDYLLEYFIDGKRVASSRRTVPGSLNVDRLTIGRFDRSSPTNSAGGNVYAAAYWPLPITDEEIQLISGDPYSYPGFPTGAVDYPPALAVDEWSDVKFYWSPDHGEATGSDLIFGALPNVDDIVPDDVEVTNGGKDGREFTGLDREQYTLEVGDLRAGESDITMMTVVRLPNSTSVGPGISFAYRPDGDKYLIVNRMSTTQWGFALRNDGGTQGGTDWPNAAYTQTRDTDLHVIVGTSSYAGTTASLDIYVDAIGNTAADSETVNTSGTDQILDKLAIGGYADVTPTAVTDGIEVYAAAVWDRVLTTQEITDVLADPYALMLSTEQTITPALLDASAAVLQPGLTLEQFVTPDLLASTVTIHEPTVTPGQVVVVAPLVAVTTALYEPTLTATVTVIVPAIAAATVLYAPTFDITIEPALLDASAVVHQPTALKLDYPVTVPAIASGSVVHEPIALKSDYLIVVDLVASTVTVYAPVTATEIEPALLDASAALHEPTVTVGSVTVVVDLLDASPTIVAPLVQSGEFFLYPTLLDLNVVPYAPVLTQEQFITVPEVASTVTVHEPVLDIGAVTVLAGYIATFNIVHEPTMTVGEVTLLPATVSATATLFEPTLAPGSVTVTVPTIASGHAVSEPTVLPGAATVIADAIDATPTLHPPILNLDIFIPTIASASAVHEPVLDAFYPIVTPLITLNPAIHEPTLVPGSVTVTIPLIASTVTVSEPAAQSMFTVTIPEIAINVAPLTPVLDYPSQIDAPWVNSLVTLYGLTIDAPLAPVSSQVGFIPI